MKKKKIIGILSTNFAGSHFLSLLMGSHSRVTHIGELKRLRRHDAHRTSRSRVCHICDDMNLCPVQANITPENISEAYPIIFNNFNDANLDALIDTSKKISWFEQFIVNDEFEWRFIHLIRDPRAAIRRWDLEYVTRNDRFRQKLKLVTHNPGQSLRYIFANRYFIYLYKWLAQNKAITDFLTQKKLAHNIVTYRQLAQNTEREIARIMIWLGYDFEPAQLKYWQFQHHGSQKINYEWIKKDEVRGHFDTRWQYELPGDVLQNTITDPQVTRYLQSLNIAFEDDGLATRN